MKSNIQKVYSKLPQKKHNFGKQKVELESVQELEETKNDVDVIWEELDNIMNDWVIKYIDLQNEVNPIVNIYNTWLSNLESLENSIRGFSDKANELGANPNDIKGYQEAVFAKDLWLNNFNLVEDTIKQMQSIPQI